MTIHLPENLEISIRETVDSGQFASLDDAMAEAARLLLSQIGQRKQEIREPVSDQVTQTHKPIWEEILELTADIPDEEWAKLPVDAAEQHDHYIYGTPKRPTAR